MERYRPAPKAAPKKYKAWHAPTIKNVCRQESRIEHLEQEAETIRQRFAAAPELMALYIEMNGAIPFYFMPRPQPGKPRLVVDNNTRKAGRPQPARGPRYA
jgi:hypothetical protein